MTAKRGADVTKPQAKTRLHGVDGLRAFAALWVLLFHIRAASGAKLFPGLDLFVRSGSTGVSLFLVLSGFCLYVPFAGGRLSRFRVGDFLSRRCRRLFPAYYASLVLIVVAIVVAHGRLGLPAIGPARMVGQTVSHASLTHQLFPGTFYGLNGAYWSLGLEWELYLTLPILILAVRRFGLKRTVAIVAAGNVAYRLLLAAVIHEGLIGAHGLLATAVLPNLFLGRWAEFALGMVAAELYVRGRVGDWAQRLRYVALLVIPAGLLGIGNPVDHVLFGAVFFTLLCVVLAGDNVVARVFSWPPLVMLGVMSYSLYLVHQPLLGVAANLLAAGHAASPRTVFVELVLVTPVIIFAAWLLFVTVERRTMTTASVDGLPGRFLLFPARGEPSSARVFLSRRLRGGGTTVAAPASDGAVGSGWAVGVSDAIPRPVSGGLGVDTKEGVSG